MMLCINTHLLVRSTYLITIVTVIPVQQIIVPVCMLLHYQHIIVPPVCISTGKYLVTVSTYLNQILPVFTQVDCNQPHPLIVFCSSLFSYTLINLITTNSIYFTVYCINGLLSGTLGDGRYAGRRAEVAVRRTKRLEFPAKSNRDRVEPGRNSDKGEREAQIRD